MERKILWFFVVALLAVDVTVLLQQRQSGARLRELERRSAAATLKADYAAEEEALLTEAGAVPASFPLLRPGKAGSTPDEAVQFALVVSVADCTNCIEDEVTRLNELKLKAPGRVTGIQGFFVDEETPEAAATLIQHLSPAPAFPLSVKNALAQLPEASTPLVLVIRSRDGKILDAHKPIPEDLTKRDAFYARWNAALGLS